MDEQVSFIKKYKKYILLILILLMAAILRYQGNNWDYGNHLHPDERYMTMVAVDIEWPSNIGEYLNPETSPLSPYNKNFTSYIYGTFPLFFTKTVAEYLDLGDYENMNLVGRAVSATFDLGTVFLVYLIGNRIYSKKLGLISAGLYALTVMAIQQSHFFTVDSFETFFITLTFFLLLLLRTEKSLLVSSILGVFIGISFGLAVGSKISAILFAGVIAYFVFFKIIQFSKVYSKTSAIFTGIDLGLIILLVGYITFRFVNPYAFASANWFDLTPQADFWSALNFQRQAIAGEVMFPPQYQWFNTAKFLYPFWNIFVWGLGGLIGLSAIMGFVFFIYRNLQSFKSKFTREQFLLLVSSPLLIAFFWIFGSFLYRGGSFVKTIRYFFSILPFIIIFASYGLYQLKTINKKLFTVVLPIVFIGAFVWSFAFTSIYRKETTRVSAANWIYENLEPGDRYANEHWDDPLPINSENIDFSQIDLSVWPGLEDKTLITSPEFVATFRNNTLSDEIAVYDPDNSDKIENLYSHVSQNDYLFVSSDRARGSIGLLHDEYPYMGNYYKALDNGELGFELAANINSYPSLFGIEINDESAEEVVWVYDHPTVRIYKKVDQLDFMEFSSILTQEIE